MRPKHWSVGTLTLTELSVTVLAKSLLPAWSPTQYLNRNVVPMAFMSPTLQKPVCSQVASLTVSSQRQSENCL